MQLRALGFNLDLSDFEMLTQQIQPETLKRTGEKKSKKPTNYPFRLQVLKDIVRWRKKSNTIVQGFGEKINK